MRWRHVSAAPSKVPLSYRPRKSTSGSALASNTAVADIASDVVVVVVAAAALVTVIVCAATVVVTVVVPAAAAASVDVLEQRAQLLQSKPNAA